MKIKKFNQINEEISREEANKRGITELDLTGGITQDEYDYILMKINELKLFSDAGNISDEEKALSEVLYMIMLKPDKGLDYDTHYHRRLGFIKANKNNKIED
jgi:hypothetical protein